MERQDERVNVKVNRRTLRAIIGGMNHWPNDDTDVVINRLIEYGWRVVDLLHQGAAIRTKTPSPGLLGLIGSVRFAALEIIDDPYACPDRYVKDLVASDALHEAILSFTAGKPVMAEPAKAGQSLAIRFNMTEQNAAACQVYAEYFTRTDAINRLIQCGVIIMQGKINRSLTEYRLGQGSWKPLRPH